MKVKIFKTLNECDEFQFALTSIIELRAGLILHKGEEYANSILSSKYKYILISKNAEEPPLIIIPDVILSDISDYAELLIIPDIEGEIPVPMVATFLYGAAAVTASGALAVTGVQLAIVYAVSAIVNIAISLALNAVMSLLSPTKEFSSDPAQSQGSSLKSSLFNGAPLIREQGGSVPLAFGHGFAGGVLISSSLTTVEG